MITVESGYHASAASPKGAQGLMQLMPDTAARFGVSAETVLEPRANLDAGARYLAFCWACSIAGWIWRWLPITLARAWCSGWGGFRRMKKPSNTSRRCAGCICAVGGRVLADGRLRGHAVADTQTRQPCPVHDK